MENNVYVFGTKWGNNGTSYEDKCVNDKVVFINNLKDVKMDFPKIINNIEVDDIILLRGSNKLLIGRANDKAKVGNALSEKPLFTSEEELNKYGIPTTAELLYVTIKEWYEIPEDKLEQINFGISRVLNTHDYKTISNEIISNLEK